MQNNITPMNAPPKRAGQLACWHGLALLGALLLVHAPTSAQPRNANNRLCFKQATNVPGPTDGQPPTVNGVIRNDLGWTGATRYDFGNGTPNMGVVVQGIRDSGNLYLSFEANNDQSFDNEDMIVIAIDPDTTAITPSNDRRLHIFPVFTTGAAASGDPRDTQYATNSGSWTTATLPGGTIIKVTSLIVPPPSGMGSPTNSWFVEVKLPLAGFGIPTTGNFGLYFNVMRVGGGTAIESFWPLANAPIVLDPNNTPTPVNWGNGTLSGTCNGVSFDWNDIKTNNTPPHKIALPPGSNVFTVTAHNNTVDASGTAIPANQVKALFKIANFGLPSASSWQPLPIPAGGGRDAASSQVANISPNSTVDLTTNPWLLNATEAATYSTPTTDHQCILVELSSTDASTIFVNSSAWRNMDFGPASVKEDVAVIDGRGYGPPPDGSGNHLFDLLITAREGFNVPGGNQVPGSITGFARQDPKIARITWVAHGYRHTGKFIVINRRRFEIVEEVGAFGHFVQHAGAVARWTSTLSGNGLKKVQENLYQILVPQDGAVTVTTKIEAVEPTPGGGQQVCLQDDRSGDTLRVDLATGDYVFTRCGASGFTLNGKGQISRVGCATTLRDAVVSAVVNQCPIAPLNLGTATIRRTPLGPTFKINDRDVTNNNCTCPAAPPGTPGGGRPKIALLGALGANFPHGDLSDIYDPGFSASLGLEVSAANAFSVVGQFGYHRLRLGRIFSGGDHDLYQLSLNGKAYLASGAVRPFVNFGGGLYHFDPGDTRGGLNVGSGLQFNLTQRFALEGVYNFHSVFTPGSNANFSTLQLGVRFGF